MNKPHRTLPSPLALGLVPGTMQGGQRIQRVSRHRLSNIPGPQCTAKVRADASLSSCLGFLNHTGALVPGNHQLHQTYWYPNGMEKGRLCP